MKVHLHEIALRIFEFCIAHKITLRSEWIPRSQNEQAAYLSRIIDYDDWEVESRVFREIEQEIG